MMAPMTDAIADNVRIPIGPVDLAPSRPMPPPGSTARRPTARPRWPRWPPSSPTCRRRLWAERTAGSRRRILLVLQGMDTSGKGGVLRHAVGLIDPQGVRITSFKAPTDEELEHDFLWRIETGLPERRLRRGLRPLALRGRADRQGPRSRRRPTRSSVATTPSTTSRRDWLPRAPRSSSACSTSVAEEQKARLQERLDNPEKHYKFNPGDLDERAHWPAYREAYEHRPRAHQHRPRAAGTSSRPTRSGSATSPSPSCCSTPCVGWTSSGPSPTSTSRSRSDGLADEAPLA